MSGTLLEWFRRLGQISGDSRQELIRAAQRHGWDVESFNLLVEGDVHNCRQFREQLSPKEVAVIIRAWRQDFPSMSSTPQRSGVPPPRPRPAFAPTALAPPSAEEGERSRPISSGSGYVQRLPEEYDDVGKVSRVPKGRRHFGQEALEAQREQARGDFLEIGIANQRRHFGGGSGEQTPQMRPVGRFAERRHFGEGSDFDQAEALENSDEFTLAERRHFRPPSNETERGHRRYIDHVKAGVASDCVPGAHGDMNDAALQGGYKDSSRLVMGAQSVQGAPGTRGHNKDDDFQGSLARGMGHGRHHMSSTEDLIEDSHEPGLDEKLDFGGAFAITVSTDGKSAYIAGASGLARFDIASMQMKSCTSYAGGRQALAGHPYGYADVVAGESCVICADLDGTLFIHHPVTCELLAEKAYEPSVFQNNQRLIAGRMQRLNSGITGLEGGYGVAPRIAVSDSAIFIGGKDGVVTALAPQTLTVLARTQLSEGPQAVGVRMVYLAESQQRLYASVLSVLHVLTPSFQPIAKLRGGPRIPIFGNICCAVESPDGSLAFAADTGGPSIHVWETTTWKWLARVELVAGGGPVRHLATSCDGRLLYASTEYGRFLAYDVSRMPPRCVEEGGGGGALAVSKVCPEHVLVLASGQLLLHGPGQRFLGWS